jgi:hypothetical protein
MLRSKGKFLLPSLAVVSNPSFLIDHSSGLAQCYGISLRNEHILPKRRWVGLFPGTEYVKPSLAVVSNPTFLIDHASGLA